MTFFFGEKEGDLLMAKINLRDISSRAKQWDHPVKGLFKYAEAMKTHGKDILKIPKKIRECYCVSIVGLALKKDSKLDWWTHIPATDPPDGLIMTLKQENNGAYTGYMREIEVVEHRGEPEGVFDVIRIKMIGNSYESNTILVCLVLTPAIYDLRLLATKLASIKSTIKHGEYLRPIALLQAQADTGETSVTVDSIKNFLLEHKIPEKQIAIKTSKKNEIDGVDLMSRSCEVRYIITVSALAEGWDCSFAYVLVSVANLGARIAVEQIIGRVIRMPQAKRKSQEELNRSYVFASARNFNEAAEEIIGGLEQNGYSRNDVIGGGKKVEKDPLEVGKAIDATLKVPMMALDGERLTFENLIEDLELAKQDPECDFAIFYDNDGRAVIDIKEDEWTRSATQTLNLVYKDKNCSRQELVQWLDKKLRFAILEQSDKVAFLEKALDFLLKKWTFAELSVNRYVLAEKLNELISTRLEEYAQKKFESALKKGKIGVIAGPAFPDTILLKQPVPREFNKNLYESIDPLNGEESAFVDRLDLDKLANIKFWVRNREKIDPFYIQGWKKGKFYPDFVAVTKKGNIIALEWKGEDRITNADTAYKVEVGNLWATLGKGKLHFFLVSNGTIEETLNKLKEL